MLGNSCKSFSKYGTIYDLPELLTLVRSTSARRKGAEEKSCIFRDSVAELCGQFLLLLCVAEWSRKRGSICGHGDRLDWFHIIACPIDTEGFLQGIKRSVSQASHLQGTSIEVKFPRSYNSTPNKSSQLIALPFFPFNFLASMRLCQLCTSATIWPVLPATYDRRWRLWDSVYNENCNGNRSTLRKTCPTATLSANNSTAYDLASN
jgi:hypothetical protein